MICIHACLSTRPGIWCEVAESGDQGSLFSSFSHALSQTLKPKTSSAVKDVSCFKTKEIKLDIVTSFLNACIDSKWNISAASVSAANVFVYYYGFFMRRFSSCITFQLSDKSLIFSPITIYCNYPIMLEMFHTNAYDCSWPGSLNLTSKNSYRPAIKMLPFFIS